MLQRVKCGVADVKKPGVKRHRSNNEQYRQQSNTRPTEELVMKLF